MNEFLITTNNQIEKPAQYELLFPTKTFMASAQQQPWGLCAKHMRSLKCGVVLSAIRGLCQVLCPACKYTQYGMIGLPRRLIGHVLP